MTASTIIKLLKQHDSSVSAVSKDLDVHCTAVYQTIHGSKCGSRRIRLYISKVLDSKSRIAVALQPQALQKAFKTKLDDFEAKDDFVYQTLNIDDLFFANTDLEKSVQAEKYFLSNVVRRIEKDKFLTKPRRIKDDNGNYKVIPIRQDAVRLSPSTCGRRSMPKDLKDKIYGDSLKGYVDIVGTEKGASYHGIQWCRNVWGCPVCSARISEVRKSGLESLLKAHFDAYGSDSVMFLTQTIKHGLGDDLTDIMDRVLKAYRFFVSSTAYKKIMAQYGSRGSSRSTEVTFGFSNGFHPHFHILHFFNQSLKTDLQNVRLRLFDLWSRALERYGFPPILPDFFIAKLVGNSEHSIGDISSYMSKVEKTTEDLQAFSAWGVQHEMTKWHIKKGKTADRFSPFDFLRNYAFAEANGDDESRKKFYGLWLTYRTAFMGKRQLWTRHKDFKITELQLSDDAIFDHDTDEKETFRVPLTYNDWKLIIKLRARGAILRVAIKSQGEDVFNYLRMLRELHDSLPIDYQTNFNHTVTNLHSTA